MREADSTSGGTDSDTTFCCCESDTESYTSDNSYTHSGPLRTQVANFEHFENVDPKCAHQQEQQQQQQHPHGMDCSICANHLNKGKLENNETSCLVAVATVTTKEIKMAIVTLEKTPSV